MTTQARPITLGLDFGTTNTVVSLRHGDAVETLRFATRHGDLDTIRTVLALWQDPTLPEASIAVGRDALAEFAAFPEDTRLVQSLKSYAANPAFRQAKILNRPYTFAQLMQTFLQHLFANSSVNLNQVGRIIVGRPVKFAGFQPDEKLALARYREVFAALGIPAISFVQEPVAAALAFARRLEKAATVLIADFGGGTTDFSVLRLAAPGSGENHNVLGVGGLGLAGDQFDYRIISHAILPHLGLGTHYSHMGKTLELPKQVFNAFACWNELSFLRTTPAYEELKDALPYASAPEKLQRLFHMVDHAKGLDLHDAVSQVKRQLSVAPQAMLECESLSVPITRTEFEGWIADDLQRIEAALDATLASSACTAEAIDSVFLTGGTSLVPAVRAIFARRFGVGKIHGGDEMISVAKGLSQASEAELQSA